MSGMTAGAIIVLGIAVSLLRPHIGLADQPRQAPRTFNSKLKLSVWVLTEAGGKPKLLGKTPAPTAMEIPSCVYWGVGPIGDTSVDAVAREVQDQSIPGLSLRNATDEDLTHLKELTGLQDLNLRNNKKVTDMGVEALTALKGLRSLNIGGTAVTDAGVQRLKELPALQKLELRDDTKVTDAGVESLKDMTGLQSLDLGGTQLTNAGLPYLKNLKSLQFLDLWQTKITDAGMQNLTDLKELKRLIVHDDPKVTGAGMQIVKSAVPGCNVIN
jgi:hypothetical protein